MVRILLSTAISLAATVLGYGALWHGGGVLMREAVHFGVGEVNVPSLLLVVAGIVLLGVAMVSVALSSIGVIVVGAIHLFFGLLAVFIPSSPFIRLIAQAFGEGSAIGNGLLFLVSTGIGLLAGIVFLVTGLAAVSRRPQKAGAMARAASVIVALVAGPMGMLLAFMGGGKVYTNLLILANTDFDATGAMLLVVGTVLLGITVLTLRWSSLGTAVLGLAVAALGFVGITQPGQLASLSNEVSRELSVAVQFSGPNGHLAMLGMLLLAAALGTLLRSRRWQ